MSETEIGMVPDVLENQILMNMNDSMFINPSNEFLQTILTSLGQLDDVGTVQILIDSDDITTIQRNFITATTASELIENNELELRTHSGGIFGTLTQTDDEIRCVSELDDTIVISESHTATNELIDKINDKWSEGVEASLRTPPSSQIYDTMSQELGIGVADDYRNLIEFVKSSDSITDIDEVSAALLVGAKNNVLLYEISKWGEDVGLASKATFSRTKTELESQGYIQTEKVPIDVGRPRLRLDLVPNVFEEDSVIEFAQTVH